MLYRKKIIFLLFSIFIISCSTEQNKTSKDCNDSICKGDKKIINCPNQKPNNSHWEDINKDGKIEQIYNGEKYVPDVYDCLWYCNNNYEKISGECVLKCDAGYEYINGECKLKCDAGYYEVNGECKPIDTQNDNDSDGVSDDIDNCKDIANPTQADTDSNGIGDACEEQDGSQIHPFIIDTSQTYTNQQNTQNSQYSLINNYPPNTLNEGGPEYYYIFKIDKTTKVKAYIDFPEPENTDIDIHLLKSITPLKLISRGHYQVEATLNQGVYYIVMDTYVNSDNEVLAGNYNLTVEFTPDYAGTIDEPIELGTLSLPFNYSDLRDTKNAQSSFFDSYPPNELNEGGHEYIYHFKLTEPARFIASIENPEPDGTDIDVHLISSLNTTDNSFLIERGNYSVYSRLEPGDYYLVMDSYVDGSDVMEGQYNLSIVVNPIGSNNDSLYFNYYILEAVDYLYANYKLLGYASANLTHDIEYGDSDINEEGHYGIITRSGGARTMCVSAQMEVVLTAMQLYAEETGDYSVYDYLPLNSWTIQNSSHIKGHIWVNHDYSSGTPDALKNFGMGETMPFEDLKPGGFVGLNRTNGTGHATTFLAFLDADGNEYDTYPSSSNIQIIGFKYFSSQGRYDVGKGGFDYRWAIFSTYDTPSFCASKRCDTGIIKSTNPTYLNTGMMWAPEHWNSSAPYYPGNKKGTHKNKIKKEGDFLPASPKDWDGLTSYELNKQ